MPNRQLFENLESIFVFAFFGTIWNAFSLSGFLKLCLFKGMYEKGTRSSTLPSHDEPEKMKTPYNILPPVVEFLGAYSIVGEGTLSMYPSPHSGPKINKKS